MIQRIRISQIFLMIFLLASFTTAWPWPPSLKNIEALIIRRNDVKRNSDSSSSAPSKTESLKSDSSSNAKASETQDSASSSNSGAAASTSDPKGKSASKTSKSNTTDKSSKSTSKPTQTISVPDDAQAGGVSLITPAATAIDQIYKIGDNIEFAWNYTSLLVPPKHIDVFVSCKSNQATYPIATSTRFEPTGRVVWNTSADTEGSNALFTDTYTLVIHDTAEDTTAQAQPGHLGTFQQFYFGMYIKRPYTPLPDWHCATCNSALSETERQTLKFVFGMCTITVLSFTWFAGGFGALF